MHDLIVIGGGAAGMFGAITAKTHFPQAKVALLEKSAHLLLKVKISGGGRCNVTHACFDPSLLAQNYPRGSKELRGPFHTFQPKDTVQWFESRSVPLKVEKDGRIFPCSDRSESIINCLMEEAKKLGVEIFLKQQIKEITKTETGFHLGSFSCHSLLLATGNSPDGHAWAKALGHTIQSPVPSLFTFNVPTSPLKSLSGIAVDPVEIYLPGTKLKQKGPLLITHFGFSGPAALKLSAWGARYLYEKNYQVPISINWLPDISLAEILKKLSELKREKPDKPLISENPFNLPKNLWKALLSQEKRLNDFSSKELEGIARELHCNTFQVEGKTTHKEEFVTCGGVTLKEVDFRTMQSKICPGLFFAGEILDIDGVTGGFNFQNAWTTSYLAGKSFLTIDHA
jgi:predicted Rossmann fold flavoprotein